MTEERTGASRPRRRRSGRGGGAKPAGALPTDGGTAQTDARRAAAAQAGIAQADAAQGGVAQGGVAQGGVAQGGVAQGGVAQGGVAQGGVAQGGVAQADAAQGGVAQGGVAQGGVAQGGVAQAGVAQAGGADGAGAQPGGGPVGGAQTGGAQTGGAQTGGARGRSGRGRQERGRSGRGREGREREGRGPDGRGPRALTPEQVERRRSRVPEIRYPENLPVSARRQEILETIRDHQVVIVAGETGSGKTTQIPKMCLELGRGVGGMIGHTQPRRIAARAVAERVAEELGSEVGDTVGFAVRFDDRVSPDTLVKVMTDGILLAEIQRDRTLSAYDTIIVDEAHERSLTIDFLLGYLRRLLPQRPDLKVIITSATIATERFAEHFGGAPVVEVSGRTYPVELRYRPLVPDGEGPTDAGEPGDPEDLDDPEDRVQGGEPRDQLTAIIEAIHELARAGDGDILVFLSGEREIRDTADALEKAFQTDRPKGPPVEVLPLFGRLSSAEQHRVFAQHTGRRVVLATNVAETSLTVPGIRYVVDAGTARISRYSHRTKVQRLPIEPISQASANQRSGRCGRVADGIAIRLYSKADYESRPEYTDPEILRTHLSSVILQMSALDLGDVEDFGFIDPPDRRNITDGVQLLEELGALAPARGTDRGRHLTETGRRMSRLPVDPRLARMVLEADRQGCLREVLVVAAALSIQDPRERPLEQRQQADEKHRRFTTPSDKGGLGRSGASDFTAFLDLWDYLKQQQEELSGNAFRRMCRSEFLNYLRIREWQDVESQLRRAARQLGVSTNPEPAPPDRVHLALLSGLLSQIGSWDANKREFLGARNARFAIAPGSSLARKPPAFVMVAELVETSRLWGRTASRIEPEWVERIAGPLLKRQYSEPHWERRRAQVMAVERVTLYGVPIVAGRRVGYGSVDPELARDLFIRHALVEGDWDTRHHFFRANRELLRDVEDLENRARRRDIVVDDQTLFDFYDARVPADVVSGRHFDSWWKRKRQTEPHRLDFTESMLLTEAAEDVSAADYPDTWLLGDYRLPLTYRFDPTHAVARPGEPADGVTVHVPLAVLPQVGLVTYEGDAEFDWQVPGLRPELATELIRSLPKHLRKHLVPAPDRAREALAAITPDDGPLVEALADELTRRAGTQVLPGDFDLTKVPPHLRVTFRVVDDAGKVAGEGKDLDELRRRLARKVAATVAATVGGATSSSSVEKAGLRTWPGGDLPEMVEETRGGLPVRGYPALVDEGESVAVRVLPTPDDAARALRAGTRRLLLLELPSSVKQVVDALPAPAKLALTRAPGGANALFEDARAAAVDHLLTVHGGPVRDEPSYRKLLEAVRADLFGVVEDAIGDTARVLAAAGDVENAVRSTTSLAVLDALTDVRAQVAALVHPGFLLESGLGTPTGGRRLRDVVRYLRAAEYRLGKLPQAPDRDRVNQARVRVVEQQYEALLAALPPEQRERPDVTEIRWMIQELRVSLFAQQLGTPTPISEQRITKAIAKARG